MAGGRPGLVLGIDAGNSKTVALVATSGGEIVGAARSGPGDISNPETGVEGALNEIAGAAEAALRSAGAAPERLGGRAFALAGADWPEDTALLRERLGAHPWGRDALIVNDALGALRAGTADGFGVVSVCGTYATSAARSADGRSWHAGFWQDTGGGFALAHEAIRTAIRSDLGIAGPTALVPAALAFFGRDSVEGVLHALTRRGSEWRQRDIARFAPAVLAAAAAGDPAAGAIVRRQGDTLGSYALAAARRVGLGPGPFPLILAGGVFRHPSRLLAEALEARVRRVVPGVRAEPGRFEPALGALLLALESQGILVTEGLLEQLSHSAPPADLFGM